MNDVRLEPEQVPTRAELLLAAEFGEDAPGRPIYARLEPDGDGDGEPAVRIKVGAVLTRRLYAAEATEAPSCWQSSKTAAFWTGVDRSD